MRIGYIHVDYEEWTEGRYNVQEIGLAKAFLEYGHEVYILYWVKKSSPKCFHEVEVIPGIKKVYLPALHFKHHVIYDCNLIKKYNFNLLHIQSDNLFFVPEVTKWCRKNEVPYYCYVGTIESSNPKCYQRILMNFLSKRNIKAYKKSSIFAKTPTMAKQLESLGVTDVTVAPVGLDLSIIPDIKLNRFEIREKLGISKEKTIIVCVCALRASKRPLDVFELADSLNSSYEIIFIGKGPLMNEFQDRNRHREQNSVIKHISYVSNKDIHEYYYAADYSINFNPDEIFGMSILEAMYQDCTVIARHAPGPDYIIQNCKNGFLVESVSEMREIIELKKKSFVQLKESVKERYTWKTTIDVLLTKFNVNNGELWEKTDQKEQKQDSLILKTDKLLR